MFGAGPLGRDAEGGLGLESISLTESARTHTGVSAFRCAASIIAKKQGKLSREKVVVRAFHRRTC
jgi:hypothetical protein